MTLKFELSSSKFQRTVFNNVPTGTCARTTNLQWQRIISISIDGHGSEPQPRGISPSARVGGSFETLRGEDSPHRSGWGPDRGIRNIGTVVRAIFITKKGQTKAIMDKLFKNITFST